MVSKRLTLHTAAAHISCTAAAAKCRMARVAPLHAAPQFAAGMCAQEVMTPQPAGALVRRRSPRGCPARGPPRWCRRAPAPPAAGGT
jgi:hypothetical protein